LGLRILVQSKRDLPRHLASAGKIGLALGGVIGALHAGSAPRKESREYRSNHGQPWSKNLA